MIITSASYKKPKGTVTKSPSMTIPDMSYTIREILNKFTTLPSDISEHQPMYDENASFEDAMEFDTDLTDITINKLKIEELNKQLEEQKKLLEEQELKKAEALQEAQKKDSEKIEESE